VDDRAQIERTVREQPQALFGTTNPVPTITVSPVARGSRGIYRITAPPHRSVIAKLRSTAASDRERAAVETNHEFGVLSAVWTALSKHGMPEHSVPRPLFSESGAGLLFMEESRGVPFRHHLWRWVIGIRSTAEVIAMTRRCGDWLREFTRLAPHIEWPTVTPAAARVLESQRVRHHVYKLIGLSGAGLATTMVEGAVARLNSWQVEPALAHRIEAAFRTQLGRADGQDTQGAVHGKFSPADILIHKDCVSAVDLEQAGRGSIFLDPAYFLYQIYMLSRWKPMGLGAAAVVQLRRSFIEGRWGKAGVDAACLDSFIAYYMCNSLRPDTGFTGRSARSYAEHWIRQWLRRAGA
jgi:hypothetical protein